MKTHIDHFEPVLLIGNSMLTWSVTVCLLQAGHPVTLYTDNNKEATKRIGIHLADLNKTGIKVTEPYRLQIIDKLKGKIHEKLVLAITAENRTEKKAFLRQIEKQLFPDAILAINTESIPMGALQEGLDHPERVIGVNWVEPAHTTFFMELIRNGVTEQQYIDRLLRLAREHWHKDPYVVSGAGSIRSRMFAAMAREAFYLVEHGYASIEDIDRACKNDAGYYLPFAGNCRYMDLMGSYAYGMVMEELNPDLSKEKNVPDFFNRMVEKGELGMEKGLGFYHYSEEDKEEWDKTFRRFSYQIRQIIEKYPFNYINENLSSENKDGSNGKE